MLSGCNVHNGGMAHRRFSCLNRKSACEQSLILHGCHRSGNSQGKKKFFKVREKSGNFTLSQGKFTSLKKVREKLNFKSTNLFTAVTHVGLVGYCFI